jgi:hypothetical protein
MSFKDKKIYDILEELKSKYNVFTHNQFINYYLLDSSIPKNDWIDIEDMLNSNTTYEEEGYEFDKLYTQILAFTSFLMIVNEEILTRINKEAPRRMETMTQDSKLLYKMTLDNIPSNLKTFNDLIINLFITVKQVDKTQNGEENAIYKNLEFINEIQNRLNR